MKLATSTGDFCRHTNIQTDAMEYLHKADFGCVDYNFGIDYFNKNGFYGKDIKGHINEVKQKADELCMELVQAHGPINDPFADDPSTFIDETVLSVRGCDSLGIKNVVVHSGFKEGMSREETIEKNIDFYRTILYKTEQYDVNILLENFNTNNKIFLINTAEDMRIVLDEVNHPHFHALLDIGHANLQPKPIDYFVKTLGKDLYGLHIHDNDGLRDMHQPPFYGNMNFDLLLRALKEIDYKGCFTFEAIGFVPSYEKKPPVFEDAIFSQMPLELRIKAEKYLYEMGVTLLSGYDCFEY